MEIFIIGIFSIIISLILFILGHINTIPYMVKLGSWFTPPGKYITALNETGNIVPIRLSIIFFVLGVCLILYHIYRKNKKSKRDKNIEI